MLWWAWIITGAILLGAELAFIDAQFYLVFLGISALIVGMVGAAGIDWAPWLQWLTFGVLSVVSMMTFRRSIYRRLRGHPPTVQAGPAGDILVLSAALPPGESCQVEFRGSFWTATNAGDEAIAAGGRAKVIRVHGLTLLVRPDA